MALLAESKRVASEFELTDSDVRNTVAEFVAQMSVYLGPSYQNTSLI
jgi:hexokinase